MIIIRIKSNDNGSHENQTINNATLKTFQIPNGYAVIPENVGTPDTLENYPFGEIIVKNIDGVPTVTRWTPGIIPPVEPTLQPAPMESQLKAVSDRQEFLEDCIAEMAMQVYS